MARPRKDLTRDMCLMAMRHTHTNRAAAKYLRVSFNHYKKYARIYIDPETGKSLWEVHKNMGGKGVSKFKTVAGEKTLLLKVLKGDKSVFSYSPKKLKEIILREAILPGECSRCKFGEKRIGDNRTPLILHHKNGDKQDFNLSNLEFLCYNCSFLYAISPITDEQVENAETYLEKVNQTINWELDQHYMDHLKQIGLWEENKLQNDDLIVKPGDEY